MIRGTDFLKSAQSSSAGSTEADWRSAVSRAYYAAFHETRDLLTALGFVAPRAEMAHAYLWRRLENCGNAIVAKAGSRLNQLRRERNRADYDVKLNLAKQDAEAAVKSAATIIETLQALKPEDRQAITDAMKTYEQNVLCEPTWRVRPR